LIKSKDILAELLDKEGWEYINVQKKEKKAISKIGIIFKSVLGLLIRDLFLFKICLRYKPSLMIGTEWAIVHIGNLLNIQTIIVNEDDTIATPENKYFYPLADTILLPDCCDVNLWMEKKVNYKGYHELAYLHPNHFVPDKQILKKYNIKENYFIIRLVKLNASHDIGMKGFNKEYMSKIISQFTRFGSVYITSEKELDSEFEQYRLAVNSLDIHHILAFATLYIGDSQTMAAEAGVLGTPFLRYNDFVGKIGYLNELENRYKLGYGFRIDQSKEMLLKISELLKLNDIENEWKKRRQKMLSEKIDTSRFMTWFIENYPKSVKIMKENPDYQNRFK
jgi:predicted glycosyltransferase